ncbi:RNA-binding protein, putative [Leishmania tarentolae]|uniref:RNA-binding protein, putative n=1 Tax=Leishmania tarentolae TaxID=5689 RepID=A0A640KNW5_LEITA|nr:RNA-binding protein, putative [Leishmania tarentolae]
MSFAQHGSAASTPAQQSKPESVAAPAAGESSVSGGYAYDPEVLRNLIVNYLPPLMNEAQVYELFGQFGRIESVKIIYDKITGESRGYGFVKYQFFFSATYAVFYLNRFEIGGKKLKVAYANAPAAKEAYDMLRSSAVALNMQQQHAMQSMYYHQMVLAQEQNGAPVASSLATSAPMGGGDDYGLYMNSVGGSYAMRQHDSGAGYAQGMHPGVVAGGSVYFAGPSTSGSRIITPAMAPIRF